MATDILLLPVDILVNIFKKLKLSDLRNVMMTCKTFKNLIINDNSIWRSLSQRRLILNCPDNRSRRGNKLSWYERCKISHNWCSGYYKSKVVIHHYTNYMPWLKFHNLELLVVSVGSELHGYTTNKKGFPSCRETVWKLEVPKVKRHDVRTNDISRFVIKNNLVVCGNRDGCVAVYRLDNSQRRPQLQCHIQDCHENGEVEVSAVEVIDGGSNLLVLTGSNDSSDLYLCGLRKEVDNGIQIQTVPHQRDVINISAGTKCMALNNAADKLTIGLNGNSKPLLLDVNNTRLLMTADTTRNPKQAVRDIQWHNENTIIYITHSGYLQMIDIRCHEVVYNTRDPFQSTLYCVKSDGQYSIVVGSAEYSRCVLFDSRNSIRHVQMYFTQRKTSPVYSLDFDASKLITAVDRGVAVLNFNIDSATEQQRDYSHVFY